MASATLTFSQFSENLKAVHTGMIFAGGALSRSATVCASSVLNMVKVPDGATLLDFWARIHTGGASQTFEIGTSQTPSGIMAVTTLSVTFCYSATAENLVLSPTDYGVMGQGWIRCPGGTRGSAFDLMPTRISLSDDVQPASVWIQGRVGADCSDSAFFTFCLFYTMDGTIGHTTIR